jgi:hypothetical protein
MATKSQIAKNGSHAAKAMAQRWISLRTISPRLSQVGPSQLAIYREN